MSTADQPLTALELAANAGQLLLLGTGAILWIKQSRRERGQPPARVEPWRAPWADFAFWGATLAFALGAGGLLFSKIYHVGSQDKLTKTDTLVLGGAEHAIILLAQLGILWSRHSFSPAPVNRDKLSPPRVFAQGALAFVTAYPVIFIASNLWTMLLETVQQWYPKMETPTQTVVQLISEQPATSVIILTVLFAVTLAPINEELLFRAGLYRFLKGKFSPRVALTAASFLFALVHANVLSFVPLFVVGWMLARAYERSGHVGVPMVFHALFNLNTIVMLLAYHGQL